MKQLKKGILFLAILIGGIILPTTVFAKDEEFSLKAYDIDPTANDWEGDGTGDEIANNANVQPGQVIQIDVVYSPGDVGNTGFNYTINYDSDIFEVIKYDGEFLVEVYTDPSLLKDSPYPYTYNKLKKTYSTTWTNSCNDTGSQIICNASDSDQNVNKPFVNEGIVTTFYLKIKDSVTNGASLNLDFENTSAGMAVDRIDKQKETISTQGISFALSTTMSSDVTLKKLELTGNNNLSYLLNPLFTSGTSNRIFNTIVPASVSSITINAEATDANGKVLPGGFGNKTLSIGNNSFNLVVQSEDGHQEIYTINIKRLSDDITLSSLSFSGLTLDYNLSNSIFTYSASAPFATKSTTVSARTTNDNAKITSGTGLWNLDNYGSIINTKTLTVEAEDCDNSYAQVSGNTCTSKNYTLNITRAEPSNNSYLSDLKIDGQTVNNFSSTKEEYILDNVSNSKTSIDITAVLSDSKASITGTGTKNLNVGDNEFKITVTAEDKTSRDYIIKVRRLSNNANLATLNVTSDPQGTLTPNFTPTFYNYYTYTYDSKVNSINISATLEDSNAQIISGIKEYSSSDSEANIVTTAEDGTTKTYVIKFSRNKSSDNSLKSLSIDDYNLNETFTPSQTLYTATVPGTVSEININAIANDSKATVSGTGKYTLNYGTNTIQVRVTAENTATKDYTITVTRSKKDISTLKDLQINGVTIKDFNENKLSYTLDDVPFTTTSLDINGIAKDDDATVEGNKTVDLKTGLNTFDVIVTAQDGTTKTKYTINVTREKSSNTSLSNLSLKEKSFEFNKETKTYNIDVDYEIDTATITATPEYKDATASISGPTSLAVGLNTYTITVTAENGNIDTYTLNITRKKSTNTSLSSLTVTNNQTNYLTNYNNSDEIYNISVPNEVDNVDINAILSDQINQTISGTGNKALKTGLNTFKIVITAASNDTKTITLNITRELNANNDLSSLEVVDHQLSPEFNANITSYTVDVDSNISTVELKATAKESTSSVEGTGTQSLKTGLNTFNITVTSENNQTKTYTIIVNKKASNDSSLASLSINEAILNEPFNKDNYHYTASVANNVDQITVNATASSLKAKKVEGTGIVNLNTGENRVLVTVTAEDNTTSTYEIIVTRAKSSNAYLTNIVLSNGYTFNETFNKLNNNYTLTVDNSTSKLKITTIKDDSTATVSGDGEITLKTGTNTILITVIAENNDTNVYTLTIERKKSSNAYLKSLTSTNGAITPTFNKNEKNYALSVPYEVTDAQIEAIAEDANAQVIIKGNMDLTVGTNEISIIVTAEDGTIETYNLIITRQKSSNNYLSNLEVTDSNGKNYIAVFNKITTTYEMNISNDIDKITINATSEDANTTIEGIGEKSLKTGLNIFTIKAISADNTPRDYVIRVTRAKNSNANLISLAVEDQKIVPDFNPDTISYSLSVDNNVDKINIIATPEISTSKVKGDGEKELTTGLNTFNIEVTAEDNTVKTYVIIVNKAASSNNYLSSLLADQPLNEPFDKELLNYTATVANSVDKINIQAIAEDVNATVSGDLEHSLNVGHNQIDITVTAENNTFRIYTIDVYREPSTNNYLSDLKVNGTTIKDFNRSTKEYSMTVENNITQVSIQAIAEDNTATVQADEIYYLKTTQENIINIIVTAQSGDTNTYTIKITRKKSSNNNLAMLNSTEGTLTPEFDKDTTKYTMSVPYEVTSLNLTTVTEDANATVDIEGNVDFQIGNNNTVFITVTAEDSSKKTYQIQVTRLPQANNFLTNITVTGSSGTKYDLNQKFDKNILNYTVLIDEDDNNLTISGTQESTSSTVVGFENIEISSFPYNHKITVTSAGGIDRIYTLTIERKKSSNADLKGIKVSEGTLTPAFDKDTTSYTVNVSSTTEKIDIQAILNKGQTVAGDGTINLNYGENNISLVVTAEAGTTKTYNIKVIRNENTLATLDNIKVTNGTLTPSFKSEVTDYIAYVGQDATNILITPILSDARARLSISLNDQAYENISSIEVTDLENSNIVKIKVTGTDSDTVYTVTIMKQSDEKITSNNYGHNISDGMIKTVKYNTSVDELKDQLDNDNSKLKIYLSDGTTEYTNDKVATGMIVKLIENDIVLDQKIIVVLGDTDGNGDINAIDALKVVNHIIGTDSLIGPYMVAADTTKDMEINAIDALKIVNHIIGNIILD